jgi:RimJ/RimL family protein N-acetyltransferase
VLRGLRLQRLEPAHEAALAALFAANDVPEVTRWFDPFPLSAETARTLSRRDDRDLYWGAWAEHDELVGMAMVRGWEGNHPQPAYGCLIDRSHHFHGIGSAVTKLAVRELRMRHVPEVRARVHDDNEGSLRMLAAAGFEEIERSGGRVLLAAWPGAQG